MIACDLCELDNGNYDFDRDCCVARFILHVPTKTMRIGYLNWLVQKVGAERTQKVKVLVAAAWEERREVLG